MAAKSLDMFVRWNVELTIRLQWVHLTVNDTKKCWTDLIIMWFYFVMVPVLCIRQHFIFYTPMRNFSTSSLMRYNI